MHWCDSSHNNNMVGPGSYTYEVYHHWQSSPHSVHFSDPYAYPNPYSSPSSSVDCTLSLGTPSTRLTEDKNKDSIRNEQHSSISNFSWNGVGTTEHELPSSGAQSNKVSRRSSGDPLFARRCANCDTASTPLWRNGPRGPKSLCNACGIRFKKEERRATAAAAASVGSIDSQPTIFGHNQYGSWAVATASQGHHQKVPSCFSGTEFRFNEDEARDHPDNGMSFLSWSLNFSDRPSGFIHDFTR